MEEDLRDINVLEGLRDELESRYHGIEKLIRRDHYSTSPTIPEINGHHTELMSFLPNAILEMKCGWHEPLSEYIYLCLCSLSLIEETVARYEGMDKLLKGLSRVA